MLNNDEDDNDNSYIVKSKIHLAEVSIDDDNLKFIHNVYFISNVCNIFKILTLDKYLNLEMYMILSQDLYKKL